MAANPLARLATRQADPMLAWGASNHPSQIMTGGTPNYITVHETANPAAGADAESHRKFVIEQGGGTAHVSFHAVVDDSESIQLMPWNWAAWHAGDGGGAGNYDSIGIENCVNSDGDFQKTLENLAQLVAKLMAEFSLPITRVVQHNHWSGKDCPTRMRANGEALWRQLIVRVAQLSTSSGPPKAEGHIGPPIIDTFNWGSDSEGVIIERQLLVYNSVTKKWYRGTWRAESGVTWENVAT